MEVLVFRLPYNKDAKVYLGGYTVCQWDRRKSHTNKDSCANKPIDVLHVGSYSSADERDTASHQEKEFADLEGVGRERLLIAYKIVRCVTLVQ